MERDSARWAANAVPDVSSVRSSTSSPVATLVMSSRSAQTSLAGREPVFTSCQRAVIGAPERMVPPGALTASDWTCKSGPGVASAMRIGIGLPGVASSTSKV